MREPELLKAVGTAWPTVASYATLLPGGLHESKADADNVPAGQQEENYGIVTATEQGIARNTNGGPIREHLLKIELHTVKGLSDLAAVQEAMLNWSTGLASKLKQTPNLALDNGGYLIDLFPAPGGPSGTTSVRRAGKMVSKVVVAWRVQSRWPN